MRRCFRGLLATLEFLVWDESYPAAKQVKPLFQTFSRNLGQPVQRCVMGQVDSTPRYIEACAHDDE